MVPVVLFQVRIVKSPVLFPYIMRMKQCALLRLEDSGVSGFMKLAIIGVRAGEAERLTKQAQMWAGRSGLSISVSTFSGGDDLLRSYQKGDYEVLLIDRKVKTEVIKEIRRTDACVFLVLLVLKADDIIKFLHWHIFDYIQIPSQYESLKAVLDEIVHLLPQYRHIVRFQSGKRSVALRTGDILYVVADNNYSVFTFQNDVKKFRIFFSRIAELLTAEDNFLICTRGVLLNMDYILRERHGVFEMTDGSSFPIRRSGRRQIIHTYEQYCVRHLLTVPEPFPESRIIEK